MRRPTFVQIRTQVLFFGGLSGVTYITLTEQADRPTLLVLFGAMMGLPFFFKLDERVAPHPPQSAPAPAPAPPEVPQ